MEDDKEVENEVGGLERVYQENIKPIIDSVSSFLPPLSLSQFKFSGSPKKKDSVVDSISTQRDYYSTVRMLESGGRNRARASTSSAYGPFQFIESTWNTYTKKYYSAIKKEALPFVTIWMDPEGSYAQ